MPPSADTTHLQDFLEAVRENCRGRHWWARVPIWFFLASVGWRQYRDPQSFNLFQPINLGIHEGGHMLFRLCGELMHVAGGTLAQLAAPIIAMIILGRQRDYFGIVFGLGWLSTNLVEVGLYMADARARQLDLVYEPGATAETIDPNSHDWGYLFSQFGLLDHDQTIGFFTRGLGTGAMVLALVLGGWIIVEMWRVNHKR